MSLLPASICCHRLLAGEGPRLPREARRASYEWAATRASWRAALHRPAAVWQPCRSEFSLIRGSLVPPFFISLRADPSLASDIELADIGPQTQSQIRPHVRSPRGEQPATERG